MYWCMSERGGEREGEGRGEEGEGRRGEERRGEGAEKGIERQIGREVEKKGKGERQVRESRRQNSSMNSI